MSLSWMRLTYCNRSECLVLKTEACSFSTQPVNRCHRGIGHLKPHHANIMISVLHQSHSALLSSLIAIHLSLNGTFRCFGVSLSNENGPINVMARKEEKKNI